MQKEWSQHFVEGYKNKDYLELSSILFALCQHNNNEQAQIKIFPINLNENVHRFR